MKLHQLTSPEKRLKILYAIQATGNGHISRANEILPLLETLASVDVLLSGSQANVSLNHPVKYKCKGLSFVFGKKGGVDFLETFRQLKTKRFLKELKNLPVNKYDLVINDFEPLSAWACKMQKLPCISLSHQYAVVGKNAPLPKKFDPLAWFLLRYYAPCDQGVGFHFKQYDKGNFTPVIRSEIRNAYVRNLGHYTVYLPAYSDKKIIKILSEHSTIRWQIFSSQSSENYAEGNCWVRPINNHDFISSFSTAEGILCGAGFETPAEALYMQKKLMVVPMKNQYEQHCNAAALAEMGVSILKKLSAKSSKAISHWLAADRNLVVEYPDQTLECLYEVLRLASPGKQSGYAKNLIPTPNSQRFAV
ncbi:MAG: glycosyl transferase [Chitinophagaceae bacterium]|nr:MAG: glycosyl transferase [Chitinophagaceae bacterium]